MKRLDINLPSRSYPIFIGDGALVQHISEVAKLCPDGRAAAVSDENVWALHGGALAALFRRQGISFTEIVLSAGEKSKTLESAGLLYDQFAYDGMKRGEPVIAFGGGVVGDLAGFAASTYMRGVPFIQIPTTLLAQVDSSVGGKVAVNIEAGKNLVGSFYQPELVIADTALLSTLPERELKSGMAEVVKYFAIGENGLEAVLKSDKHSALRLEQIVHLCCRRKAHYVEMDELDRGERMMLNFGHSFGHAIEKLYDFEKYNHGEAVAIGMVLAAETGERLKLTESGTAKRIRKILDNEGIDYHLPAAPESLVPLMQSDKKNSGSEITLILLKSFGKPFIHKIERDALTKVLKG